MSRENGQTTEAIAYYTRALRIAEQAHGSEHHRVADALHSLAVAHFGQGHWLKAEDYGRRSAEMIVNTVRRAAATSGPLRGTRPTKTSISSGSVLRPLTGLRRPIRRGPPIARARCSSPRVGARSKPLPLWHKWRPGTPRVTAHTRGWFASARIWSGNGSGATNSSPRSFRAHPNSATAATRLSAPSSPKSIVDRRDRSDPTKDFPAYRALASTEPPTIAEVQVQLLATSALAVSQRP